MAEGAASAELVEALFAPRGVALVGATEDPRRPASRPLRFLRRHGWQGAVYPINPSRATIDGAPAFPALDAVPGPVDHAFLLLGAERVPEALAACGRAGVRVATVFAGGFAEEGADGLAAQARLLDAARAAGVRLVGPNSIGLVDTRTGYSCTASAAFEIDRLLPGRLAILSQSGSVMSTLMSRGRARSIGFSRMLSVGNEADLAIPDLGPGLLADPGTDALLLFLEAIRDPDGMARLAWTAARAGKPVLAYKVGRSAVAQEVAASHTGALAGSDAAVDAFLRDLGILRVDQIETLVELPALAVRHGPAPRPGRVGVVATTGGGAAMAVDRLGLAGVDVVAPGPATARRLAEAGIVAAPRRVLDLTLAGARPEVMGAALDVLLDAEEFDAVLVVIGASATVRPEEAVAPMVARAGAATPLAVFVVPEAPRPLALLAEAGVACFRTPEACGDGLAAWLGWRAPRVRPSVGDLGSARAALAAAGPGPLLNELESQAALGCLGIPFAAATLLDGPVDPALGWPVAAKVLSRDLPHKTEADGVRLGIADAPGLAAAARAIRRAAATRAPEARIEGILVQRMVTDGVGEALVGYRIDPQVGPLVTVGMGGTMAEIYRDVAIRPAPVDVATARVMLDEVKGFALLRGWRGRPPGDLDALARAVAALSRLAGLPGVEEAEINPLVVRAAGAGVAGVDALVRRSAEGHG